MGFYVGSASRYLSGVCLNSKEHFKGKRLPGDAELAWFTFKWIGGEIMQNESKKQLCDSQKTMVCYFNPLLLSALLF